MKNNPQIIKMMQKSVFEPLYKIAGNEIRPYFLEEQHFKDSNSFPYNISPLESKPVRLASPDRG